MSRSVGRAVEAVLEIEQREVFADMIEKQFSPKQWKHSKKKMEFIIRLKKLLSETEARKPLNLILQEPLINFGMRYLHYESLKMRSSYDISRLSVQPKMTFKISQSHEILQVLEEYFLEYCESAHAVKAFEIFKISFIKTHYDKITSKTIQYSSTYYLSSTMATLEKKHSIKSLINRYLKALKQQGIPIDNLVDDRTSIRLKDRILKYMMEKETRTDSLVIDKVSTLTTLESFFFELVHTFMDRTTDDPDAESRTLQRHFMLGLLYWDYLNFDDSKDSIWLEGAYKKSLGMAFVEGQGISLKPRSKAKIDRKRKITTSMTRKDSYKAADDYWQNARKNHKLRFNATVIKYIKIGTHWFIWMPVSVAQYLYLNWDLVTFEQKVGPLNIGIMRLASFNGNQPGIPNIINYLDWLWTVNGIPDILINRK